MSSVRGLFACGALAIAALLMSLSACAAERPVVIPAAAVDDPKSSGPMQTAVLAGGCFWGVQGVFEHLSGVSRVLSGYAGGNVNKPTYEMVSTGDTGHAESVEITFDPKVVSYGQILQVFFSVAHDPTQLNRQGPDSGTQYRSAIFYTDGRQKEIATAYVAQLGTSGVFHRPIVTRIDPLTRFFPAEDYHQDYLIAHPKNAYIVFNDLPKIRNFQGTLPGLYREKAVEVPASNVVPVSTR